MNRRHATKPHKASADTTAFLFAMAFAFTVGAMLGATMGMAI